jgi:hypothetical protein
MGGAFQTFRGGMALTKLTNCNINAKHTASITALLIAVISMASLQAMLDVGTFEVFGNTLESHVYGDIGSRATTTALYSADDPTAKPF